MSVDVQLRVSDTAKIQKNNLNHEKLRGIIKTVILSGQQNLALRGPRDEKP